MKLSDSEKMYEQACRRMPGGVNSPVRAYKAVGGIPPFIDHAEGSRIYDIDGNAYIDYVGSYGPMLLGHAREEIVDAICAAAAKGTSYGAPTPGEVELAEMICACVPGVEKLRLVNSGTEACMSAIRAARGYTGRDLIVKFEGCYHGHSDGLLVKAGSGLLTQNVPDSAGVPAAFAALTMTAQYNDEESVRQIFEARGQDIAALIVEPVAANMGVVLPQPGFLQFLRDITKQYGTVLIFDEVITGFRLALGGAGAYYEVQPDLVTLGKVVGGGMPMAAYGGKARIMEMVAPDGPVYQAGTLSGNPAAVAAGIASLKLLTAHPEIYEELDAKGAGLEEIYRSAASKYDLAVTVNRVGSLLSVFFTEGPVTCYQDVCRTDSGIYKTYFTSMLEAGIYLAPSRFEAMFLSTAHSSEDLKMTAGAVDQAFALLSKSSLPQINGSRGSDSGSE